MRIAVIGAGRVGTAIAVLLGRAGHNVVAVSGRAATRERAGRYFPGVPVVEPAEASAKGELVLVAVPDDDLGSIVLGIAATGGFHRGQWVAHVSGANGLDALDAAHGAGARRLAIHPLQTLPDVERAIERIPGCVVAVTADDEEGYLVAESLARDLGGSPFRLDDELRPIYHAGAVFASNYLVATTSIAERLFAEAGMTDPSRAMAPLQRATLDNIEALGSGAALTGPAVRGDAGTVERHLEALAGRMPDAVAAYVSMARVALELATRSGRLTPEGRTAVEAVLARWG
jgi:predicted short-subunit dehydrogenase-like oxidoreductase (DUF2520 family)